MRKKKLALAVSMSSIVLLSGCAAMEKHKGKIIGAVSGAAAGALACDGDPVCIAVGLVGGLVLGELYDARQEKLRKLAEEKNIALEMKTITTFNSDKENALELSINDGGMFEVGSENLKTSARLNLMSVATIYRQETQKILVIGHTDASGSDAYNQQLSERRARTVAKLFEEIGVPVGQIYFQGAGESQPITTNDTPEGRSDNRRVEIIEIDSETSLTAYNLQRQNDRKYLAHSSRTQSEKQEVLDRVKATTPEKKKPQSAVAKTTKSKAAPSIKALVDFGGQPASSDFSQILLAKGDTKNDEGGINFSLFSKAVADTGMDLSPCFMDAPRKVGDIQNLSTGQKLAAADLDMTEYWPGLNGNVWVDTVNGHMIAFQDLRVMRDSGSPEGQPTVRLYKDIASDNTADFVMEPYVESYPGEDGLLLRTYFNPDEPMECLDVVMANSGSKAAKAGVMYYGNGKGLYQQTIRLERIR
jgi:outer membrane protein OmpA-like peptidoglycan-associated protein